MIVEEIMNKNLKTITPDTTISEAIKIMALNKIRHLPVTDPYHCLVGIISDRDIRDASPSIFNQEDKSQYSAKVDTIMTMHMITGTPLDFVEDVAALFYEFKISCLPILADEKLVGIITESDLLRTLMHMTGANEPSSHIELKLAHRPGSLCQIIQVFQKRDLNILNILLYPSKDEGFKRLVIRTRLMNTDELVKELLEKGFEVLWPRKK
ncbi:MAG: CBS and ACT domain-containing protein [Eubacteriales bacterium]